jgi:hypothetical protein
MDRFRFGEQRDARHFVVDLRRCLLGFDEAYRAVDCIGLLLQTRRPMVLRFSLVASDSSVIDPKSPTGLHAFTGPKLRFGASAGSYRKVVFRTCSLYTFDAMILSGVAGISPFRITVGKVLI